MTPEKALVLIIAACMKALLSNDTTAPKMVGPKRRGRKKRTSPSQVPFPDLGMDVPGDTTLEEFFSQPIPDKAKMDVDRPKIDEQTYRPSREVDDDGSVDHVPWMSPQ